MATSFPDSLNALSQRLRRRIGIARLLAAAALAGAGLGMGAAADAWMQPLSTGQRWGALAASLGLSAALGFAAFSLAKKRWRGGRLAGDLDARTRGDGLFATAWETLQAPPEADALRRAFCALLQAQAAAAMAQHDLRPIIGRGRLIGPAAALAAVIAALGIASVRSPEFRTGLHRVGQPWWEPPPPVTWRDFVLENRCTLDWPNAFGRAPTPADGPDLAFPEQSTLVWNLRLAPGCTGRRIELRRQGERMITVHMADFLPQKSGQAPLRINFPKAGRFEARIAFDVPEEIMAKTGEPRKGVDPTHSPWVAFECRKDLPPTVVLEKPEGPEQPASPIAPLPCAVRAHDDWGLRKAGIGMMVDGTTTEEALLPLADKAGQGLDAAGPLELRMARHANLSAESSILVFAFAEDMAGHRTVSRPVALDIQPLFGEQNTGGPKKPGEKDKDGGPPPPDGKEKPDLNMLIRMQRAVTGKTLSAPGDLQQLVRDQQRVLQTLETGALPPEDEPTPGSPPAAEAPLP